ncbi:ester cyclase [Candidatus Poribacteria bacterium]|nr:ester cyclase [Candidatus Poribacteria bacterium]
MSEENKAIARRFFEEGLNRENLAVVDEILAVNFVSHAPTEPGHSAESQGPERLKEEFARNRVAFPDMQFTIEDQIAEGDKVVTRWTFRGTHKGDLMGIAPTGKRVSMTGINIQRIAGGKIEEEWVIWDSMGMMQQLGVMPPPGQGGS